MDVTFFDSWAWLIFVGVGLVLIQPWRVGFHVDGIFAGREAHGSQPAVAAVRLALVVGQQLVDVVAVDLIGPCGFGVDVAAEDKVNVRVRFDQIAPDRVSGCGATAVGVEIAMGRDDRLAIEMGL